MQQLETYAHQLDSKSSFSANANNKGVFVPGICMHVCNFPPNNTGFSVRIQIIEECVPFPANANTREVFVPGMCIFLCFFENKGVFVQMTLLEQFMCQVYVYMHVCVCLGMVGGIDEACDWRGCICVIGFSFYSHIIMVWKYTRIYTFLYMYILGVCILYRRGLTKSSHCYIKIKKNHCTGQ